ncbi:hypothetical protein [Dietzia sp. 179-F 9C3 NHS]|uniref:hypothetical protein n=1 Tax=Dietzia sp. 179-F 9C3 NHS TaxID=3374295 RepID=UPI0038798C9E
MSTDTSRLNPDENRPIGRFEAGLRDIIYDGLIRSLDSTDDELEQGLYYVTLCDGTTAVVVFDFTEFDEHGEQTMPCHWVQRSRGLKTIDKGPDGRFGMWSEAVTWLRQAAQSASMRGEGPAAGIS